MSPDGGRGRIVRRS